MAPEGLRCDERPVKISYKKSWLEESERLRWWAGWVVCAVCGNRHVSVIPFEEDNLDDQECPGCGCMSCDPIELECV